MQSCMLRLCQLERCPSQSPLRLSLPTPVRAYGRHQHVLFVQSARVAYSSDGQPKEKIPVHRQRLLHYCPWRKTLNPDSTSDSMVQPQMDRDWFWNVSNFEPNRIGVSIYACIRSLFANFLTLKLSHTCTCHSRT